MVRNDECYLALSIFVRYALRVSFLGSDISGLKIGGFGE